MERAPTRDDVDALVGPATPHFAYQIRARVKVLVAVLPEDHPVREFMFHQRADYSVLLKIVPKDNFSTDNRRAIQETVSANLPGLDVRLELVDDIPRTKANKWRPVLTEVLMNKEDA